MPSTYTLNNGIELIGTGEQSGTWGDTTNLNLELLDTALDGQVTVTLSSTGTSGSPNVLPISDGTSSNGRNRMVIFNDGSDIGGTVYVQLTPNDAEKIIYVRNSLSGSRSILLFQGTYNASNDYEVPAGTTAVVFFDGAGSGAVAANVFNNAHFDALNVVGSVTVGGGVTVTGTVDAGTVEFDNLSGTGAVSVTNILDEDNMASNSATALSTQQSIKAYVDSQVGTVDTLAEILANGNTTGGTDIAVSTGDDITFADNSKAIFGAGSDLQIYHDSASGQSIIHENGPSVLKIRATDFRISNADNTADYLSANNGAEVSIRYNGAVKLATTNTGVDITGTLVSDGLTVDGTVTGNIASFINDGNSTNAKGIKIQGGTDNGFGENYKIEFFDGDGTASGRISTNTGSINIEAAPVTINEAGSDLDFRVESSSNTHALFVDAGGDYVSVGTAGNLNGKLNVSGSIVATNGQAVDPDALSAGNVALGQIADGSGWGAVGLGWKGSGAGDTAAIGYAGETLYFAMGDGTNANSFATVFKLGRNEIVVNEDSNDIDFRVESDGNDHALFVDGGSSTASVSIGNTGNTWASTFDGVLQVGRAGVGFIANYDKGAANYQTVVGTGVSYDGGYKALYNDAGYAYWNMAGSQTSLSLAPSTTIGAAPAFRDVVTFYEDVRGTVFNDGGHDDDFRVESDNNSDMLKVDASVDRVYIKSSGGVNQATLGVGGTIAFSGYTAGSYNSASGFIDHSATALRLHSGAAVGGSSSIAITTLISGSVSSAIAISDSIVINEDSVSSRDFRVESDGNTHALFVDAGNNRVTIGSSSGYGHFNVNGNIVLGGAGNKGIYFGDNITSSADQEWLLANNASSSNSFILYEYDSGSYVSQRVEFLSGGNTRFDNGNGTTFVINEAGNNADFRVESDSVSDMFVVDAGANCVNIGAVGSTTTNYSLFVRGNNAESGTNTYYVQKIGASNYSDAGQYTALIGLGVEPNAAWSKGAIGWRRSGSYDRGDMVFLVNNATNTSTASNSDERMRINSAGVVITGNLAKSSGSFRIDHPLPEKSATHNLVHSFVEAPQADNIYRGKIDLVAGQATANIDTVAGMTDGTFAALNREIQCFTSNETGWTAVRGSVSGNILTIEAQDNTCTDTVSWLVVGERQDQHMYDTEWTDENGKVIVEPLKPVE